MSMIPLGGVLGSAAGAPLSQTTGSESERAHKDSAAQSRSADSDQKAERASGIGQTEQDQQSSDRDADGRRLWEEPPERSGEEGESADGGDRIERPPSQSKDASGQSGTQLDLSG